MTPLFASTELVARIEREESELVRFAAEAARRRDPAGGIFTRSLAGGVAAWAGEDSPFNKVAGWGFGGTPRAEELAEIEFAFAQHATAVRVELASLADPELPAALARREYRFVGCENVLGLSLAGHKPSPPPAGVSVTKIDAAEFSVWLDAVVTGSATPDDQGVPSDEEFPRAVLERVLRDLASMNDCSRYVARRNGEIAGGADLRISGGIAQFGGSATLPSHRRNGVQTALLQARLEFARAAGCDVAVVTTQPGSKSQQNVQRQGFELLYVRTILVRG